MLLGSLVFGGNLVVMYCGYPTGLPARAMTLSLTRSRLYLFPLTSETQLTLDVVVRMLCPIGNEFVQPAIKSMISTLRYDLKTP